MQSVDEIAREIVRREGGYVNDPDDPGGATKYGVTIHTMRRLGLDLTQDGRIDAHDVKALSEAEAVYPSGAGALDGYSGTQFHGMSSSIRLIL